MRVGACACSDTHDSGVFAPAGAKQKRIAFIRLSSQTISTRPRLRASGSFATISRSITYHLDLYLRTLMLKLTAVFHTAAHPPSLPPTVEEAYRRKCIQLKERSKEIEEENDGYRLRLSRLRRQIQKLRLERAIILDQIAKRTSTNVEDSEGSPSPPPTVRSMPAPP